jgi:hypothetical protein
MWRSRRRHAGHPSSQQDVSMGDLRCERQSSPFSVRPCWWLRSPRRLPPPSVITTAGPFARLRRWLTSSATPTLPFRLSNRVGRRAITATGFPPLPVTKREVKYLTKKPAFWPASFLWRFDTGSSHRYLELAASSAKLSSSTLTRGSPINPARRPSVFSVTS